MAAPLAGTGARVLLAAGMQALTGLLALVLVMVLVLLLGLQRASLTSRQHVTPPFKQRLPRQAPRATRCCEGALEVVEVEEEGDRLCLVASRRLRRAPRHQRCLQLLRCLAGQLLLL